MQAILALYNNPVILSLLKNNVIFFGAAVREAVCGAQALDRYLSEQRGAILGYTDLKFQEIIERDLYGWQASPPTTDPASSSQNVLRRVYLIRACGDNTSRKRPVKIRVNYLRNILASMQNPDDLCGSAHDFDVNLLQIDREGIGLRYVPPSMRTHPAPIVEVLNNCHTRRFRIVCRPPTDGRSENWLTSRVARMVSIGWEHLGCKVVAGPRPPSETCTICRETYQEDSNGVKLECSHSFHHECWKEHVIISMENSHSPHTTRCPLCRCPVYPWEEL